MIVTSFISSKRLCLLRVLLLRNGNPAIALLDDSAVWPVLLLPNRYVPFQLINQEPATLERLRPVRTRRRRHHGDLARPERAEAVHQGHARAPSLFSLPRDSFHLSDRHRLIGGVNDPLRHDLARDRAHLAAK